MRLIRIQFRRRKGAKVIIGLASTVTARKKKINKEQEVKSVKLERRHKHLDVGNDCKYEGQNYYNSDALI